MNTLLSQPVSSLLTQLFNDANASSRTLQEQTSEMSEEQVAGLMQSDDYQGLYSKLQKFHLAVSADTATLLYLLTRSTRAKSIVEFGTSFGISTLHLASALRDNGGGRLITTEFEPYKVMRALENISTAGLSDLVDLREGDALETLARDLPETIDLVLLDGAKSLYPKVLALLAGRLRTGALIVADNADWCPEYLQYVRTPANGYLSVPFGEDIELSMKL